MTDTGPAPAPRPRRRRRLLRWMLRLTTVVVLLLAGAILLLAFPPDGRSVPLPDAMRARVEALIDDTMPAGNVSIGGIGLSLSRGTLMPRIHFTDMRLTEDGRDRVVFPVLEVELDRAALFARQVRPRQVALGGAGLRIRRDADGSFDLALSGTQTGEVRDLSQTLAGIDRMFRQTVFSRLERISAVDITLVVEDVRSGETLTIDGAELLLIPDGETLTLSVGGQMEGVAQSDLAFTFTRHSDMGETAFAARFTNLHSRDVAVVSDALAWLTLVDAPMAGRLSTVLYDDATLGTLSGALEVGAGLIDPGGGVEPLPLDALTLAFDYDAEARRMWIGDFTVEAPALSARISGHATLLDGPVYVAQLQVAGITADPPGVFEAPISFAGGAIDLRLQLDPVAAVDIGQAVLFDEGLHLTLRGRVAAEPEGLALRLDASLPEFDATRVPALWPVDQLPNTRDWLIENLIAGQLHNVRAGLRLVPGNRPDFGLTFDFDGAEVRAVRQMAPIQEARGYLDITRNVVSIAVHEGFVTAPDGGQLVVDGSVMRITDTRQRPSPAEIVLQITGPISSALTLIGAEPFTLLDQFPFDPGTVARGQGRYDVTLGLDLRPALGPGDIDFEVVGLLRDVVSTALVPGRTLRAETLALAADNDRLSIGGVARLDGLEADATWQRALGPDSPASSVIEGRATLTPGALARFGVRLPEGMLTGRGQGAFTVALAQGAAPQMSLTSDLAGLALSVPALGWSLSEAATGRLSVDLVLGESPEIPLLELAGAGLSLEGAVLLDGPERFDRLRIDRLRVGDWLDVTGALIGADAEGQGARVEITGGSADLRGLPSGSSGAGGSGAGGGLPLNLRLDRFEITDAIYLTDLRAELSGQPVAGTFRGRVGGEVPVAGSLFAEDNGTALRLRADDGGAVLRAAGIYGNAYGGDLDLILRPRAGEGQFSGLLTIDNPRLRNAPAFAELLSAISVVGLLDQMASGEGVALGDVRAVFTLSPGQVSISEGTALGPAMGLSLDGIFNTESRYFDFEGVVSPFYMVNGLMGGLFTPRREGLFGFTYRLTGTPENSNVSVNPLSVFTPGIFREIFRRPPPEPAR